VRFHALRVATRALFQSQRSFHSSACDDGASLHRFVGTHRLEHELSLFLGEAGRGICLLTEDHSRSKSGVHHIALDAYEYRWYRMGGLAYILERER
jgi:hypothetical protein